MCVTHKITYLVLQKHREQEKYQVTWEILKRIKAEDMLEATHKFNQLSHRKQYK